MACQSDAFSMPGLTLIVHGDFRCAECLCIEASFGGNILCALGGLNFEICVKSMLRSVKVGWIYDGSATDE